MGSPEINFVGAIAIGLVIGIVAGLVLRSRSANAIWLAPLLAVAGSLAASVLALIFGDDRQYGWKEPILQVVLAVAGVAVAYFIGTRRTTTSTPADAQTAAN
jgi:uncharacterized membrane protein YeaQ/YmgE (transglycosylase-associated protein family)